MCLCGQCSLNETPSRRRQVPPLLFEVVCFRCPPERGVDHEGAGAEKVVSYESLKDGSEVINHVQGNSTSRASGLSALLLLGRWRIPPTPSRAPEQFVKVNSRTFAAQRAAHKPPACFAVTPPVKPNAAKTKPGNKRTLD